MCNSNPILTEQFILLLKDEWIQGPKIFKDYV